jgi:hypothetical protein
VTRRKNQECEGEVALEPLLGVRIGREGKAAFGAFLGAGIEKVNSAK